MIYFLVVMNLWSVHMAQVNSSDYNTTIHLWPHANSFYMNEKYLKILDMGVTWARRNGKITGHPSLYEN